MNIWIFPEAGEMLKFPNFDEILSDMSLFLLCCDSCTDISAWVDCRCLFEWLKSSHDTSVLLIVILNRAKKSIFYEEINVGAIYAQILLICHCLSCGMFQHPCLFFFYKSFWF